MSNLEVEGAKGPLATPAKPGSSELEPSEAADQGSANANKFLASLETRLGEEPVAGFDPVRALSLLDEDDDKDSIQGSEDKAESVEPDQEGAQLEERKAELRQELRQLERAKGEAEALHDLTKTRIELESRKMEAQLQTLRENLAELEQQGNHKVDAMASVLKSARDKKKKLELEIRDLEGRSVAARLDHESRKQELVARVLQAVIKKNNFNESSLKKRPKAPRMGKLETADLSIEGILSEVQSFLPDSMSLLAVTADADLVVDLLLHHWSKKGTSGEPTTVKPRCASAERIGSV